MKTLFLFFVTTCVVFTINAQSADGTYTNKWVAPSGESLAYNLTLDLDGTFLFQSIRTFKESIPDEINYTSGTWTLENHLLTLKTTDAIDKITSDINMNKARYVSVSNRNPKFNNTKPFFTFFESKVFYAKNMQLFKTEDKLSITD